MRGFTVKIYDLLCEHEEGLTTAEIIEKTGIKWTTVRNALVRNNFFYIDRWTVQETSWRWTPVWRLAVGSEQNAPRPTVTPGAFCRAQVVRAHAQAAA